MEEHDSPRNEMDDLCTFLAKQTFTPDLLSVAAFENDAVHDGRDLRYRLVVTGINQAGFLGQLALGFLRSGFCSFRVAITKILDDKRATTRVRELNKCSLVPPHNCECLIKLAATSASPRIKWIRHEHL